MGVAVDYIRIANRFAVSIMGGTLGTRLVENTVADLRDRLEGTCG